MPDKETTVALVAEQLSLIQDALCLSALRGLLVDPYPVLRDWDYGEAGQQFVCWTVMEHRSSNTGIAYCDEGFGPSDPWGLVFLSGTHTSIGMDSGWYRTLEDAFRESMAWEAGNPPNYEIL